LGCKAAVEETAGENRREVPSMPLLRAKNKQKPEEGGVLSVARG
jgi:hypothetical protein